MGKNVTPIREHKKIDRETPATVISHVKWQSIGWAMLHRVLEAVYALTDEVDIRSDLLYFQGHVSCAEKLCAEGDMSGALEHLRAALGCLPYLKDAPWMIRAFCSMGDLISVGASRHRCGGRGVGGTTHANRVFG